MLIYLAIDIGMLSEKEKAREKLMQRLGSAEFALSKASDGARAATNVTLFDLLVELIRQGEFKTVRNVLTRIEAVIRVRC